MYGPVAVLPQRDHLFVTGVDDGHGLVRIAELARPLLDEPHRVTGRAFVWRDGAWLSFVPPHGHPSQRRFLDLVRVTDAANYEEHDGPWGSFPNGGASIASRPTRSRPPFGAPRSA
jgi:hypothetical protein